MHLKTTMAALAACLGAALCAPSFADITVGLTLSLTGPGSSLAIPTQKAVGIFPREIAGEKIKYVILDDASDPAGAVKNFHKLVDEYKADVVMGSSISPATLPLVNVAAETHVPLLSLAASSKIVEPQDEVHRWTFKALQNQPLMMEVTVDHMIASKVKSVGFIGFSNAYGESWLQELTKQLAANHIELKAVERYGSKDTSVTAQVLKLVQAKPDAILIAAAGTPGALPQKALRERGFKGLVYQTYGIANQQFLQVAGKDAEGALFSVGPMLVADQLPTSNPIRAVAMDWTRKYEARYGKDTASVFAANAWDSYMLLSHAIEAALPKARPGTAEFRSALRDALEATKDLVTSQGVMTMSPQDHVGYDKRAAVMVQIHDGHWKYVP